MRYNNVWLLRLLQYKVTEVQTTENMHLFTTTAALQMVYDHWKKVRKKERVCTTFPQWEEMKEASIKSRKWSSSSQGVTVAKLRDVLGLISLKERPTFYNQMCYHKIWKTLYLNSQFKEYWIHSGFWCTCPSHLHQCHVVLFGSWKSLFYDSVPDWEETLILAHFNVLHDADLAEMCGHSVIF